MDDMTKILLVVGLLVCIRLYTQFPLKSPKKVSKPETTPPAFDPDLYPDEAFQISYKKYIPMDISAKIPFVWQGRSLYYREQFAEAIDLLTQEIDTHIDDIPVPHTLVIALDYRARIYRSMERLADALSDYDKAIRRSKDVTSTDWITTTFYAGCAQLAADEPQAALELFNTLIENLPQGRMGNVLYSHAPNGPRREREQARQDLNKAIKRQPKERVLYYCRALAECSLRDWDNATADCQRGLLLSGVDVNAEPARLPGKFVPLTPSKDHLEEALRTQLELMPVSRRADDYRAQRVRNYDLDHMESKLDYAQVLGSEVMVYNFAGVQYSETLEDKSDRVISRQLIRDGWQFTASEGTNSANNGSPIYYFKRSRQG